MSAHASYMPQDATSESIGIYPSVEEAQRAALSFGAAKVGDFRNLHWRQFSETTWGLMSGGIYTHILVARIATPG